jgi:hypothetical protein
MLKSIYFYEFLQGYLGRTNGKPARFDKLSDRLSSESLRQVALKFAEGLSDWLNNKSLRQAAPELVEGQNLLSRTGSNLLEVEQHDLQMEVYRSDRVIARFKTKRRRLGQLRSPGFYGAVVFFNSLLFSQS